MSGQKITLVLQHLIVRLRVRVETQTERPFASQGRDANRTSVRPRVRVETRPEHAIAKQVTVLDP